MLKGFTFLLKYTWKFNKMYVVYAFAFQLVVAVIPLLTVIMPKFIIDELSGSKRIYILLLYVGILIGINLVGGLLSSFLQGRMYTSKGVVFTKFQCFIAERQANSDFEQLESADFLDAKKKAAATACGSI